MKLIPKRAAAILALSAAAGTGLSGCTASDVFSNFDGFLVSITCQIDALFNVNHCRLGGRLHRSPNASGNLDLSSFTLKTQAMGTDIASYPSTVNVTLLNNGSTVAAQTFALTVDSQGNITLADPYTASNWVSSYGASATDVSYSAVDDLTAPVYAGTNTISVDNQAAGTSLATASYSSRYGDGFTPYPGPR